MGSVADLRFLLKSHLLGVGQRNKLISIFLQTYGRGQRSVSPVVQNMPRLQASAKTTRNLETYWEMAARIDKKVVFLTRLGAYFYLKSQYNRFCRSFARDDIIAQNCRASCNNCPSEPWDHGTGTTCADNDAFSWCSTCTRCNSAVNIYLLHHCKMRLC